MSTKKNVNTKRVCLECEKTFEREKWRKQTFCSISCGSKNSIRKKNIHTDEVKEKISNTVKRLHRETDIYKNYSKKAYNERRGKNHYRWKGGITPTTQKIRSSQKYKKWRAFVFERDDYTCQECDKRGGYLEVHHVEPFRNIMECKERLWNTDNGITVCIVCHSKIDKYRNIGENYA